MIRAAVHKQKVMVQGRRKMDLTLVALTKFYDVSKPRACEGGKAVLHFAVHNLSFAD